MKASIEEREIIKKILTYCEDGGTDMQADVMLNPVSNYTDPALLAQEIDTLFRTFPIIIGHASDVAEPGQFFTHNETGVPILVTRNRNGQVKAFMNVCRHRGARVENKECGHARTFSCPYHAWTYDLDGKLRGMPQPVGFEGLDKAEHGLIPLPAFEEFGLIWVMPSASDEPVDIKSWLAPMAEQFASIDLGSHVIFRKWSVERKMSWRLALEGFQESYHFCSAHEHTACSTYLDNQSVALDQYPHVRHAVPLTSVVTLKDQSPEDWDYRGHFLTQNYLFPCNFIQVMTDHVYVHTIIPTGQGTCEFQCMMLIPEQPKTDKAQSYWEKNYDVIRTVFNEDFEIGESIQQGLATGANSNFTFGRYECGLHLGQKAIDDALEGRLTI